jgi:CheY-like chemotaxis protein
MGIIIPVLVHVPKFDSKSRAHDLRLSDDPTLMVSVSNQIRKPLNALMGFADLLKDPKISETSKKLYLSHIRTSGKYLRELVNNITDITLIESGTLYINKEECQLNQLLSRIHLQLEKLLVEKNKKGLNIKLFTGVQDEDYTILTDEIRLYQLLVNLIENALSFTDERSIEFGYYHIDHNTLEFFVKDTGTGLSPERLELLFSKFNRVIDNQMRPFDIIALRISLVRHLVRLFGSELRAESQPGKGSDFRFKLRISSVTVEKKPVEVVDKKSEQTEVVKWENKKILIAEDVESNFVYLKEILKQTGVDILWAENGKEAVDLCQKHVDVDVVLMDILMPEMDGYDAALAIKKDFPDLPIIALTAFSIDDLEYKGASNYFSKFIIKPIWSIDLLNTLTNYLDSN